MDNDKKEDGIESILFFYVVPTSLVSPSQMPIPKLNATSILTITGVSIEQVISWVEKRSSNRQVIFDVCNTGYITQGAQINLDSGVSYDAVVAEVNYYDKINGTCPDCTVNWHN